MVLNNRINIGVYGQDIDMNTGARTTRLAYSYTASAGPQQSENEDWKRAFFEPRDARAFNTNEIFAIWFDKDSIFYGIIFPVNDAGDGRKVLAINVKRLVSNNGSMIIQVLRKLRDLYEITGSEMNNEVIDSLLQPFDQSLTKSYVAFNPASSNIKGYRVYSSEAELAKMLTYPYQNDYKDLKCVFFSPNDLNLPNVNLKHISSPLTVLYQIGNIPSNVSLEPSRKAVYEGSKIKLTYHKDGCDDCPLEVTVGRPSPTISYDGNIININDANTAMVTFMRRVYVDFVEDGTNNRVNSVTIRTPEGKQERANSIRFLENKRSISFTAIANGFHEKNVTFNPAELTSSRLKVVLKPKSTEQSIDIVFPDYTRSTIKARVKQSDPLYKYLERTGWQIHVSRRDFPKPPSYSNDDGNGNPNPTFWQKIPNWLKILVPILLIALLLLFGLKKCAVSPFSDKSDEDQNTNKTEQVDNTQHEAEEVNTTDIIADLDYLKQNDRWSKQEIKTDEFKPLMDFIKNGQVEQAFTHRYNNEGNINGYWKNCLDIYKEHAKDTEFIVKAGDAMSHSFENDVLNLQKLNSSFELLSRQNDNHSVRDVTKPSTSPIMSPSKTLKKADSNPAGKPKADPKPTEKSKADPKPSEKPKADPKPAEKPKKDQKPKDD